MSDIQYYISIAENAIAESKITSEPQGLYAPINYTMELGGKRLRPALMLMCCEAFGSHYSTCISQAVGLEYYHNFTLLHDDVMDNADVRRGKPSVHRKWDTNTAILSGDAMLTLATKHMLGGKHGAKITRIMEAFNRTAMEVYEGQQYDMEYENRTDVSVEEYMNMIRLKTSVLFGCACQIGAIVAGARVSAENLIYEFGENLGLAFQLQDDYLDVYGDSATFGKEIGGDILNAKRTFMLISAYNRANEAQIKRLDALLDKKNDYTDTERIKGVTEIYNELDIPQLCRAEIQRYTKNAEEALRKVGFDESDYQNFVNFMEKLMHRSR